VAGGLTGASLYGRSIFLAARSGLEAPSRERCLGHRRVAWLGQAQCQPLSDLAVA